MEALHPNTHLPICRGIRGATTIATDDRESILQASRELLALLIRINHIDPDDVASVIFTTTQDVASVYPALAARQLGWMDVPLLCSHEMAVPGGLPRCIRILIHWSTSKRQQDIRHIYLRGAQTLRPDRSLILSDAERLELEAWIDEQMALWQERMAA